MTGARWTGGAENCNIGLLLGRCGSGAFLEAIGPAKFLAESLKAASSIHKFLLSGEKRVAIAANIDVDPGQGAARCEGVSACTVNRTRLITRMNFFFHGHYSFGWNVRLASHGRTSVQHFDPNIIRSCRRDGLSWRKAENLLAVDRRCKKSQCRRDACPDGATEEQRPRETAGADGVPGTQQWKPR